MLNVLLVYVHAYDSVSLCGREMRAVLGVLPDGFSWRIDSPLLAARPLCSSQQSGLLVTSWCPHLTTRLSSARSLWLFQQSWPLMTSWCPRLQRAAWLASARPQCPFRRAWRYIRCPQLANRPFSAHLCPMHPSKADHPWRHDVLSWRIDHFCPSLPFKPQQCEQLLSWRQTRNMVPGSSREGRQLQIQLQIITMSFANNKGVLKLPGVYLSMGDFVWHPWWRQIKQKKALTSWRTALELNCSILRSSKYRSLKLALFGLFGKLNQAKRVLSTGVGTDIFFLSESWWVRATHRAAKLSAVIPVCNTEHLTSRCVVWLLEDSWSLWMVSMTF